MKIIHTADLHLGQVLYQYYDRVDEHEHFFEQLNLWCHQYKPDALLVSGDVYDIPQPGAASKEFFNRTFVKIHKENPDMTIVVTAGNHDSPSRIQADSSVWGLSGVTLIGVPPATDCMESPDGWQDRYIVDTGKGFIIAMPFVSSNRPDVLQALLDRVAVLNEGKNLPVVMTGHLAVNGGDFTGHGNIGTLKTTPSSDLGNGFDYLALGHIHRPQTIGYDINDEMQQESLYPSGIMRYSGSALHVSCDETYPHSVSLVEMESHGGDVKVTRLRIDELRHFYILPESTQPPIRSAEEATEVINDFCQKHKSGYFRLRLDYNSPLPNDFIQNIYKITEATGNEIRYNPKPIEENRPEEVHETAAPVFEVAELQQMTDPLNFIRKTISNYPGLDINQIESDFAEIEKYLYKKESES